MFSDIYGMDYVILFLQRVTAHPYMDYFLHYPEGLLPPIYLLRESQSQGVAVWLICWCSQGAAFFFG